MAKPVHSAAKRFALGAAILAAFLLYGPFGFTSPAQAKPAARGSNPAVYPAVASGTRFLIRLESEVGTAKSKRNARFSARTLEPLATPEGFTVPPGAEIRGHISRVEPAGVTGRARLWL
ncbi:MAG: hypothetical protein ACRD5L_00405, partial [Bryobacteraceae bacterium]